MSNSNISSGILKDILGLFGIPSNSFESIYSEFVNNRRKEALDILFTHIKYGHFSEIDKFELIAVIERYMREAIEGAARNNLKLLSKLIFGMAEKSELKIDFFSKYARVIAELSKDELVTISVMAKGKYSGYLDNKQELELLFGPEKTIAICQALLRTGLISFSYEAETEEKIRPASQREQHYEDIDEVKWLETTTWANYDFTPFMKELLKYVDFDWTDEELP